jgi:hypothetical protein
MCNSRDNVTPPTGLASAARKHLLVPVCSCDKNLKQGIRQGQSLTYTFVKNRTSLRKDSQLLKTKAKDFIAPVAESLLRIHVGPYWALSHG